MPGGDASGHVLRGGWGWVGFANSAGACSRQCVSVGGLMRTEAVVAIWRAAPGAIGVSACCISGNGDDRGFALR
ncbi:MAG: hypothetical protein ACO2PN_24110 [Pyrobaculum sp.]